MSTGLRLTFSEYSRLIERGLLDELRDRRIELIYGEMREMPAPGPGHAELVDRLMEWSQDNAPREQFRVRVQNPIDIPRLDSAPMPDVAWVRQGDYSRRHPLPQESLLVVEVADSTLAFDLGEKALLYSQAGIPEYWVIDVQSQAIVVHRSPAESGYADVFTVAADANLSPIAKAGAVLRLSELFRR